MGKKEYVAIADCLKTTLDRTGTQDMKDGVENAIRSLSWTLADLNPLFDRGRFLRACGLDHVNEVL